ncbi:MAG: hypothetical protein JWP75_2236, partial [Frondihabitans sp.]|nr:hypothetical protein [Frondihabitans sp.]
MYGKTDTGKDLTVSIYKPKDAAGPAPTIFYVHGGGWTLGDANQLSTEFRHLADQGYLVVTANYELATLTDHTW